MTTERKSITAIAVRPQHLADRVREMQAQARALATEHVDQFRLALEEVARLAGEIADGGDAYPVGARELGRQLAHDAQGHAWTLQALAERRS